MIDRASKTARDIVRAIIDIGLGPKAYSKIVRILRDEFADIEHNAINEIRLRESEDE